MIKVIYNKVCGRCVQSEPLTSGMVGQPIHFEYSHDFDGLAVTAVFTDGKNTVDVVNPGNECIIPHEVLTTVGAIVKVGIYAVRGNELVIPTIYAHIGVVLKGADPSGDVSADPTLPVWAQTQAMIGNLNDLTTEAKNNLVAAINEAAQTGGGGGGSTIELDTTLSEAGKAADAKAVGDALAGKQDTLIQSGATVGQIAKITAVDDSGKPTAWSPVDMPDALPNPNALTFTGAVTGSYDGSAPVSVAIPSGGDAGKSVRHIATVAVTTGTTSYSVTVDSNGDALNLESVYILTEKFWGNNGSYVQVDVNGKVITKAFGQIGSPQVLELEKMGELQKFTNIPKPSDVDISFGDYYNGKSAVTSVGFWSAASNVDTTIEIYGVDA